MLGEIGGHLQRRVEGDIESQLVADGVLHLLPPGDNLAHIGLEDAGRVVHRAALQACKRQNGGVAGMNALAELGAHSALVANHIGPRAAEARGSHRLVGVDHNMMLGSLHDGIVIVVVDGLAVMPFGEGDDGTHVAALHGIVAILIHKVVSLLHPALVVDG